MVPNTLVVANLAAAVWGEDMSRNMGLLDIARFSVAFFCTGPLGRLGDRYGSRTATAVVAVLQTLPTLVLFLVGNSAIGLTAWSVARVVTGITGTTTSGAPALYALLHDVVAPEDFDAFLGIGFAGCALLMLVSNIVGAAILRQCHGSSNAVLLYVLGLSTIMMAIIGAISVPTREHGHSDKQRQQQQQQQQRRPQSLEGTSGSGSGSDGHDEEASVAVSSNQCSAEDAGAGKCAIFASLQMALSNEALLKLCAIAALVSIPETVLIEVMNQFSFESLDLMGSGASGEERSFVTFHNVVAMQVSLLLGSYAVGVLAPRLTSLRLLRWLIPACALLQSLPAVVHIVPAASTVVVAAIALGLSLVVLPPLQALVPQFSPKDRVGEALGTVGAFKCIASLVGNIVVSIGVPAIQITGLEKPLWILFPACGLISLCGLPFALQLPAPGAAETLKDPAAGGAKGATSTA